MNHCFKKLYYNLTGKLGILSALFMISVSPLQAMEPQHLDTDTNKLIFKLLTLKAEYLGEELHDEIEKIKPLVYATVTEEKIRQFIDWVPTLDSDEYKALPYKIPVEICFDIRKEVNCRDLLLGAAYFPKECEQPLDHLIEWGGYRTDYVYVQLAYSHRYKCNKAYMFLQQAAINFLDFTKIQEDTDFYRQEIPYTTENQTVRYTYKKVKLNVKKYEGNEDLLCFNSQDGANVYFNNLKEKALRS